MGVIEEEEKSWDEALNHDQDFFDKLDQDQLEHSETSDRFDKVHEERTNETMEKMVCKLPDFAPRSASVAPLVIENEN